MVENNTGNRGYLSDAANEDGLFPIHGIAIGNNDITVGHKSKEPKLWRPDVLEEAAGTLEGKKIVVNHENRDAYEVIGQISESKFDEERGVIYRGEIDSSELAKKINHGWLEVSPRIIHSKAHDKVKDVKIPESIREFDNLSIVSRGAAGSNEVNLGEAEELSVAELQDAFEQDSDEEVSEYQNTIDGEVVEELQESVDYARWMFDNPEGAIGAAEKFGCGGTHKHEVDGKTWHMPCDNHDTFLKNWKKDKQDEMEEGSTEEEEVEEFTCADWDEFVSDLEDGELGESTEKITELQNSMHEKMHEFVEDDEFEFDEEELESIEEELEKHLESDEYSGDEKRIASQMSSYSELTKDESLAFVDMVTPQRQTDPFMLVNIIEKLLDEDEMEVLLSELEGKHKDQDSILNKMRL